MPQPLAIDNDESLSATVMVRMLLVYAECAAARASETTVLGDLTVLTF